MDSWRVPYLPKGRRPDFNNGPGGDSNSDPVLAPGVYLSLSRIMAPPILCQMKSISVQVSYNGGYNDFSTDVSKQIGSTYTCTKPSDMLTSLGQSTQYS